MNDREAYRHQFRTALFQRRGLDVERATALADRLVQRDADGDDRHACIECKSLSQSGTCFAAKTYQPDPLAPVRNPVPALLNRCRSFEWQTPA